jgi:hypothetical protein
MVTEGVWSCPVQAPSLREGGRIWPSIREGRGPCRSGLVVQASSVGVTGDATAPALCILSSASIAFLIFAMSAGVLSAGPFAA